MKKIPQTELRKNLAQLVRRCIAGETFELESYGKPVGVMLAPVPVQGRLRPSKDFQPGTLPAA